MKVQTSYDKQTVSLIAVVIGKMPKISKDRMQWLIEHPKVVEKVLKNAFCSPAQDLKSHH